MKKSMTIFRCSFFTSLIFFSLGSFAEDYFDPALLDGQLGIPNDIDLSQFSSKDALPEGKIILTVYVNNSNRGETSIHLVKGVDNRVVPEITLALLKSLGVKIETVPNLNKLGNDEVITDLTQYIPDASVKVNLSELKLVTSFPQIVMSTDAVGYIDPAVIDSGVTAMFVNYMFSGGHSSNDNSSFNDINNGKLKNDNFFAQFRTGFNYDEWRLRSTITHTYARNSDDKEATSDNSTKFTVSSINQCNAILK